EGVGGEAPGDAFVQHREARIEAGCQRVRTQQASAEAVDRRDPGALARARSLAVVERLEAGPHARLQLGRSLLGEGDREDAADVARLLRRRSRLRRPLA